MQKIENIILDYGNVIFMIDFNRARQAFITLGIKNVDDFFGHKAQDPLFDAFDKGEITPAEFRTAIREKTNSPELSDQQIDDAWNALLIGVPQGKHEVLLALREKYRTFLLSNNNEIHYAYCMQHIQEKYGIPNNDIFFEKAYYSHQMGMRKPNAEIFEQVVTETGINPATTLFIDDSPQHLATANQLGFQTALCTSEDTLEILVERYRLL
ncbi:HAD family hydrolase [Sphingobacterium psychroaquaticum]|uniref:Putative hydrolase of the HAD superfamily n=1 Tax=Sphingobacterium psychroaquaticum TaxID=561061 RepID=A0A1X7I9D6_9SPHI|nr:HAD family phosphatase [Sphingobacterium psychroaquaticum]SMG11261.1 putative hydrolase of the HAD superfamily [Sphingobacterium psychroaquaticum]